MRNVPALVIIFLLCSVWITIFTIKVAEAEGKIYIRANGSIEGTDRIQQDGNIYTFTGNIFDSIIVERNNIIVDGVGYTLEGMELGIALNLTTSNVTIKNIYIIDWEVGILGVFNNNTIMENVITGCDFGIKIYADNYKIIGNYIGNNGQGIHIANAHQIFVFMNNITNSGFGINLLDVEDGEIVKNIIAHNEQGIHCGGPYQRIYLNNFINNTVAHYSGVNFRDVVTRVGNYYSDYKEKYPNATELGNSGIWNTPYTFSVFSGVFNQDKYPLTAPVDIEVIPEYPSWTPLMIMLVAVVVVIVIYRRSLRKHAQRRNEK